MGFNIISASMIRYANVFPSIINFIKKTLFLINDLINKPCFFHSSINIKSRGVCVCVYSYSKESLCYIRFEWIKSWGDSARNISNGGNNLCVCMCSVSMDANIHGCKCAWRLEPYIVYLPCLLSALFFETGSLNEHGVYGFGEIGWLVSSRDLPFSILPNA